MNVCMYVCMCGFELGGARYNKMKRDEGEKSQREIFNTRYRS